LLCTLHGPPVGFAPGGAKADERLVLLDILADGGLPVSPGQVIIGDKDYYGRDFENELARAGLVLLCPQGRAGTGRPPHEVTRVLGDDQSRPGRGSGALPWIMLVSPISRARRCPICTYNVHATVCVHHAIGMNFAQFLDAAAFLRSDVRI
jgi:hypothetical protein